ncbi:MAG TPA: 4'-phosphopantetheinyl transferase superfamily protein [Phnomibacter sp.]|nr:4'-phosphopantetheinyl transferase superfamily protein [Phnomibacter sp.]
MPLFYSQTIDPFTKLAIWHITEDESFFLEWVPVSREFTHPHKRLQHLAGRFLLQHLFPDFPLSLIQIATTRKPYLPQESHHFSISHCGNYAAAIVSTRQRVGIDIEQPSERVLKIAPKFLHEQEVALLQPFAGSELVKRATLLWCAKEAMYKWYSLGEIDFKQHLRVNEIHLEEQGTGIMDASFQKFAPQSLSMHYMGWPNLALTWLVA